MRPLPPSVNENEANGAELPGARLIAALNRSPGYTPPQDAGTIPAVWTCRPRPVSSKRPCNGQPDG